MKLPIVALIGQTNAGKSSLLNRFARQNIAIVAREAGTTRDNVTATIDGSFLLIDTAGLKNPEDDFEASIQDQIADAIDVADLILITMDSTKYPDFRDTDIARLALRSKKPLLLALNKSDLKESLQSFEFLKLGLKDSQIFKTSATTGQGIAPLKSAIRQALGLKQTTARPIDANSLADNHHHSQATPTVLSTPTDRTALPVSSPLPLKIALIGRPNVGKSSLFNSLAKKQQVLVSSRQGTTRDINRVELKYKHRPLEILDTAGLRKPGKREVGIEKFSALRTLAAIEEADICALLIDSTEPRSKLDQSLAGQIVKAGKGIILVLTKTDLLPPVDPPLSPTDRILNRLENDYNFLPFAPVLITSSVTGKNTTKLFELATKIDEARHTELKTSDLNRILNDAILSHPPAGLKNTHPKPKYIVQTDTCPPWFVIHGREMELLHWSYKRYLERKIREFYPFTGTPIMLSFHNDR